MFNPEEIDYIEANDGKCYVYVRKEGYVSQMTLDELEQKAEKFWVLSLSPVLLGQYTKGDGNCPVDEGVLTPFGLQTTRNSWFPSVRQRYRS